MKKNVCVDQGEDINLGLLTFSPPHFKVYLYTTFVPKCPSIRSANEEFEINVIFSIKFPTISMIPMSSLNLWGKKLILSEKKLFLSHCSADQTNILGQGGSTIFVSRT